MGMVRMTYSTHQLGKTGRLQPHVHTNLFIGEFGVSIVFEIVGNVTLTRCIF